MWSSPEIETVPHWEEVWWDMDRNRECSAPTGTPWNPNPNVRQRTIERIYGKQVHRDCDGSLEVSKSQDGCGKFQVRLTCQNCYTDIVAEY